MELSTATLDELHTMVDAALIVHVLEELYQHLGHAELAADVLRATD